MGLLRFWLGAVSQQSCVVAIQSLKTIAQTIWSPVLLNEAGFSPTQGESNFKWKDSSRNSPVHSFNL
jgi:hypothetical protein